MVYAYWRFPDSKTNGLDSQSHSPYWKLLHAIITNKPFTGPTCNYTWRARLISWFHVVWSFLVSFNFMCRPISFFLSLFLFYFTNLFGTRTFSCFRFFFLFIQPHLLHSFPFLSPSFHLSLVFSPANNGAETGVPHGCVPSHSIFHSIFRHVVGFL